jgi:hypothetical protein
LSIFWSAQIKHIMWAPPIMWNYGLRSITAAKEQSTQGVEGRLKLKYTVECESHSEACKLEYDIKQYSRDEKAELIKTYQKNLKDGKAY